MSRIQDEMYETAKGLHKCGVIDDRQMLEYEARYRAKRAAEAAEQVVPKSVERRAGNEEVAVAGGAFGGAV